VWENSSPFPVLLGNIASQLVIKGLWETWAAAAPPPILHATSVLIWYSLDLIEWWTQPPTVVLENLIEFPYIDTDGWDGWFSGKSQDYKYEWIFNSYDLHSFPPSLAVPPKGRVLFRVMLGTSMNITGTCGVAITIQGGDSSVLCPFLQFEVTEVIDSGPPLP
jgi:hypothetical protein